jgi:hypothetical protein
MNKLRKSLYFIVATFLAFSAYATDTALITTKDNTPYTTAAPAYQWQQKIILGRVENIYHQDIDELKGVPFIGKIDTGADTTSMHAENIEVYSNNPKYKGLKNTELMQTIIDEFGGPKSNWWLTSFDTPERNIQGVVKFDIRHPTSGKLISLEYPLARTSVIRSRTSKIPLYRPVINIPLTIANVTVDTDVNLTDRSGFSAPILIGKTFLKEHALVFAGYDYLQSQQSAHIIGRNDPFFVDGLPLQASFSLVNNYSQLHATGIQVDKQNHTVTFDTANKSGQSKTITATLARMLKVSGKEHPLVYVNLKTGDFEEPVLVYLKDRSKFRSQLHLGKNTLSQYFVINTQSKEAQSATTTYAKLLSTKKPLVVTTHELIYIDGIPVNAKPSFSINTPVLFVQGFELTKSGDGEQVSFYIPNSRGNDKKVIKKVERKIRVGDLVRPVIKEPVMFGGKEVSIEYALEAVEHSEQPYFAIGRGFSEDGVLINTRTEDLLDPRPLFSAGFIEKATVEGMTFSVKLDTGADVSSMNALNIQHFTENNKPMVSFDFEDHHGQKQHFTREVVDIMNIRAKAGEQPNKRPVVMMQVRLGNLSKNVRVNLQDRSRFAYSMILGKNFLKNGVVVSSDDTYLLGK